jgi:hypothetical protein
MSTLVIDNTFEDPTRRAPLVLGHDRFDTVTEEICKVNEEARPPKAWFIALGISGAVCGMLGLLILYLFATGVGVWGNNNPVMWGFPIVNFVFWVGIGHAGTLISAILFLFRQKWRTAINRFAEAMTIFAVICAGTFPGIHVGRVWVIYWVFPIPNQMSMWPQFRSPLLWDVFAVGTYFTVSLLFWYVGMIPDLATLRDRSKTRIKAIAYGFFALGWRGSMRHWHRYEKAYLLLAALATPLVLSVHSVVSFDFAVSQLPGWHTTIFPPYFVAGAIFSGFAMVMTLAVPARQMWGLKNFITMRHLENLLDRVLHRLVLRRPVRAVRVREPCVRPALVGVLDHGVVQRHHAADLLVQGDADEHPGHVRGQPARQRRHVVRTIRDHHLAGAGLPAVELGVLQADLGRHRHARGQLRSVHDALPAVHPLPAGHRDRRGEGDHAGGESARAWA